MKRYTRAHLMKDVADTTPSKRARKRRARRRPRMHWGRLIVCIVIFAVIAVVGLVSGTIVAVSHNLPNIDAMKRQQLGQDTVIFDRNGNRIAELYGAVNRVVVPSHQIPAVMKNATVAIEDKRFYQHHGVDFTGIARALVDDIKAGHVVQGASTITEQYVKNAYIGADPTLTRKLKEAVLAWELEDRWSKDKILTEYLNTVYYGAGAYGVQAASLTYFHKPVSKVTLPQAALLAALPKFPSEYSPITDPQVITERRNLVLDGMAQQGYITVAQATAAKAVKLRVYAKPLSKTKDPAAYFVDYVTGSSSTATAPARSTRAACACTPRSTCPCRPTPSPRSRRSCPPRARPAPSWPSTRPTATSASCRPAPTSRPTSTASTGRRSASPARP